MAEDLSRRVIRLRVGGHRDGERDLGTCDRPGLGRGLARGTGILYLLSNEITGTPSLVSDDRTGDVPDNASTVSYLRDQETIIEDGLAFGHALLHVVSALDSSPYSLPRPIAAAGLTEKVPTMAVTSSVFAAAELHSAEAGISPWFELVYTECGRAQRHRDGKYFSVSKTDPDYTADRTSCYKSIFNEVCICFVLASVCINQTPLAQTMPRGGVGEGAPPAQADGLGVRQKCAAHTEREWGVLEQTLELAGVEKRKH